MAKKGKELNPADALRKKERKKELKKNKDDKKKKEQLRAAYSEALRIAEELGNILKQEKDGSLDKSTRAKKDKIERRLDEINVERRAANLPIVTVSSVISKQKNPTKEGEYKWYHPTFNPHGPKKPPKGSSMNADGEDDSDSSDDDSDDENGDITSLDYSRLPLPNGEAPMDSQFYHNLDLPELRLDILPPNSKTPNPPPPRPIASAHPVPLQSTIPMGYPPLFPPAPMGMPPLGFPLAAPPGFPPTFPPPPFFPPHMPPPPIPAGMPPAFPPAMPPYIPPPHSHYHPYPPPHARQRPPPPPPPRRYQHHHDAAGNAPQFNVRAEIARNLSLPPKPAVAVGVGPMSSGPVVISAEPQMRDLQKELTQFVPSRVLKKRGASGAGVAAGAGPVKAIRSGGKLVVNAAPDVGDIGDAEEETNLGRINRGPETIATPVQDDEEYSAFMKEIGS